MGYTLEFNCLLVVPNAQLDLKTLKAGDKVQIIKDGSRLYPVDIPIEICDKDTYTYYGKVAIRKLTLQDNKTVLEIEMLKVFNEQESRIYTSNFIDAKPRV